MTSPIYSTNPWEKLNTYLSQHQYSQIFVLADHNTKQLCFPILEEKLQLTQLYIFSFEAGESSKNLETAQDIWTSWLQGGIDRSSLVIALGGGVVCDIGGFCASLVWRGVDFIYIPTTLIGMVDAAIGGKNGINFLDFKNQIGLYQEPKVIVVEPDFLHSLSQRHIKNGFVEMIKHSLIQSPSYYEDLLNLDWPVDVGNMDSWIRRSIRTKQEIVEADFKEKNVRKSLNFGHTIGHAIESYSLRYSCDLLHGECVALGMIAEAYISHKMYNWRPYVYDQVMTMLKKYAPPFHPDVEQTKFIMETMRYDKKNSQRELRLSLLESPGKPRWDIAVNHEVLQESLEYIQNL